MSASFKPIAPTPIDRAEGSNKPWCHDQALIEARRLEDEMNLARAYLHLRMVIGKYVKSEEEFKRLTTPDFF